jgi:hypothetical protein
VGLGDVSQQIPLELTLAFPSLVIFPPDAAVVWVISFTQLVVTTGVVAFLVQTVKQFMEHINIPTII